MEPIEEIHKTRWGYLPQQFAWRDHRHDVESIERVWAKLQNDAVDKILIGGKEPPEKEEREQMEPIEMHETRWGYLPQSFTWRGHRYDVKSIERVWTKQQQDVDQIWSRARVVIRDDDTESTMDLCLDRRNNTSWWGGESGEYE